MTENFPRKNLDFLLNAAWFGGGEAHYNFKKSFAIFFGLGNSDRSETFQFSANAVLLFNSEATADQSLEQIYDVHAGNIALILALPHNTADADAVLSALFGEYRLEVCMNCASGFGTSKLDQAALRFALFFCPARRHSVEISVKFQDGLAWAGSIGIEKLRINVIRLPHSPGVNQG